MKMKQCVLWAVGLLFAASLGGLLVVQPWNGVQALPQTKEKIQAVSTQLDEQLLNDALLAASSNPYDSIKNNPAFDALVAEGVSALPEIEQQLNAATNDGLDQYILAIAVEQITQTDLKQQKQTHWQTGKGFAVQWDKFLKTVPAQVEAILQGERTRDEISEALAPFGLLAQPYLADYVEGQNLYPEAVLRYTDQPALSRQELEFLRGYIENR